MLLLPVSFFQSAVQPSRLLDGLNVSTAHGLFLMLTSYTGACLRVRRGTDNTETDVGFTAAGLLDQAALLAFCGSGSGWVSKLYDQSINAAHAAQVTAANQPQIVSTGTVLAVRASGSPGMAFNAGQSLIAGIAFSGDLSFLATAMRASAYSGLDAVDYVSSSGSGELCLGNGYGSQSDANKARYDDLTGTGAGNAFGWLNGVKQGGVNPFTTGTGAGEAAAFGVTRLSASAQNNLYLGVGGQNAQYYLGGAIRAHAVLSGILTDNTMAALTQAMRSEVGP